MPVSGSGKNSASANSVAVTVSQINSGDTVLIFAAGSGNNAMTSVSDSSSSVTWDASAHWSQSATIFSTTYLNVWRGVATSSVTNDVVTVTWAGHQYANGAIVISFQNITGFDSGTIKTGSSNSTSTPTVSGYSSSSTGLLTAYMYCYDQTKNTASGGNIAGTSSTTISNPYSTSYDSGINGQFVQYVDFPAGGLSSVSGAFGATAGQWFAMLDSLDRSSPAPTSNNINYMACEMRIPRLKVRHPDWRSFNH